MVDARARLGRVEEDEVAGLEPFEVRGTGAAVRNGCHAGRFRGLQARNAGQGPETSRPTVALCGPATTPTWPRDGRPQVRARRQSIVTRSAVQ